MRNIIPYYLLTILFISPLNYAKSADMPSFCSLFPKSKTLNETLEQYGAFHSDPKERPFRIIEGGRSTSVDSITYATGLYTQELNRKNLLKKKFKRNLLHTAVEKILATRNVYMGLYQDINWSSQSEYNYRSQLLRCARANKDTYLTNKVIDLNRSGDRGHLKRGYYEQAELRKKFIQKNLFHALVIKNLFKLQGKAENFKKEELEELLSNDELLSHSRQLSNDERKFCVEKSKKRQFSQYRKNLAAAFRSKDTLEVYIHKKFSKVIEGRALSECTELAQEVASLKSHMKKIKELKQERKVYYDLLMLPLYAKVKEHPLLFERVDDFNLFADSESKLAPSRLTKYIWKQQSNSSLQQRFNKVISAFPNQYMQVLTHIIEPNENSLRYLEELEVDELIDSRLIKLLFEKELYRISLFDLEIDNLIKRATKKLVFELNHSATAICNNKGENLHHFPLLYNEVGKVRVFPSIEPEESMEAYCHELRDNPIVQSSWSATKVAGMGLIAIGTVAQVVPAIGNLTGAVAIGAGSSLYAKSSVDQAKLAYHKFHATSGLHTSGYISNYKSVLERSIDLNNKIAHSVIDIASLVSLDTTALYSAAKKLNSAQRAKAFTSKKNQPEANSLINSDPKYEVTQYSFNVEGGVKDLTVQLIEYTHLRFLRRNKKYGGFSHFKAFDVGEEPLNEALLRLKASGYRKLKIEDGQILQDLSQPIDKIVPEYYFQKYAPQFEVYAKALYGKSLKSRDDFENIIESLHVAWMEINIKLKFFDASAFRDYKDLEISSKLSHANLVKEILGSFDPQILYSNLFKEYKEALENAKFIDDIGKYLHEKWHSFHWFKSNAILLEEVPLPYGSSASDFYRILDGEGFSGLQIIGEKLYQDRARGFSSLVPELKDRLYLKQASEYAKVVQFKEARSAKDIESIAIDFFNLRKKEGSVSQSIEADNYFDLTPLEKVDNLDELLNFLKIRGVDNKSFNLYTEYKIVLEDFAYAIQLENANTANLIGATGRSYKTRAMRKEYLGESSGGGKAGRGIVEYFSQVKKDRFTIYAKDGKLVDYNGELLTIDSAKYIMDTKGKIIAYEEHHKGGIYHSSLISGKGVGAAGYITVKEGKITMLSRQSGHYQPDEIHLEQMIKELSLRGVSIKKNEVESFY